MQPSSLIFLVIVAIWVTYLIQHWVGRREHLATARSVDRFSEAMRVLERRTPLPSTMLAAATAAKESTKPKGAREEMVVERATVSSPLRARAATDAALPPVHDVPPIELIPHRTFAQILARRVRGVLFLAALVAIPATITLSAIHILKWLSVALAVGALLAVLVWLRVAAIADKRARRARRTELRRLEQLRASGRGTSTTRPATPPAAEPTAPAEASPRHTPQVPLPAEADVDPDAWQPVPVPPPTYTLKEPAHRPDLAGTEQRPVPIDVEDDEVEVMAAAHQRRVVGS